MQKPKKVALKIVSVATYVVFLFYIVMFALTGLLGKFDDGAGYGFLSDGPVSFVSKHIGAFPQIFGFGLPSGIIWSIVVYLVIVLIVCNLFFSVKIGRRQQRLICANGMVALYLAFIPASFTAGGFHLYSDVIGKKGVYAASTGVLNASCWILLISAAVYLVLAVVLWILCRHDAQKYPGEPVDAKPVEEPKDDGIVTAVTAAVEKLMIEEDEFDMTLEELRLMIRQIVNEELDKREQKPTVVNNYYGAAPVEVAAPAEPAPAEEPAPVEEAAAKPAAADRIPFAERIVKADKNIREAYNEIKNELLAYGAHSRISISGDTFRLHRKTYAKVVVAGKGLKIYFALDPKDYADSPIPHSDASDKTMYEEIPFVFKVKSDLSRRRAVQLIADVFARDGIEKGEAGNEDYVKQIRAELRAAKK